MKTFCYAPRRRCVRRLRSKLGFDLIKTVRGQGYQLIAVPG
jgi:DNA-binding response OmpR family regulator